MTRLLQINFYLIILFILIYQPALIASDSESSYLYLIGDAPVSRAQMTPLTFTLHASHVVGIEAVKIIAYAQMMQWHKALMFYALWDLPWIWQPLITRPITELAIRDYFKTLNSLKAFKNIPTLNSVSIITNKRIKWAGPIALYQDRKNIVLLETKTPIDFNDSIWKKEWGTPTEILNRENTKLVLQLKRSDWTHSKPWISTFEEILNSKSIPEDIYNNWSKEYQEEKKRELSLLPKWERIKRYFLLLNDKNASLEATLLLPDQTQLKLGSIMLGGKITGFLGLNKTQKMNGWIKKKILRAKEDPNRPLPITLSAVKKWDLMKVSCGDLWKSITGKILFAGRHTK